METTPAAGGYRAVSGLAVAALFLGGLSSLALVSPLLWALPLLGVGLAAAALADVSREGAEKAGRAAALAGLALSIGFGTQAVAARFVAQRIMADRARAVAGAWLDAIRDGRLIDARGMVAPDMLPAAATFDTPTDPDSPPESPEKDFAAMPVVARIIRCGGGGERRIECREIQPPEGVRWQVTVRLPACADGGSLALELELDPRRQRGKAGAVEQWLVSKFELAR